MNDFIATGKIIKARKVTEKVGVFLVELDNEKPEFKRSVLFTTFKNDVFEFVEKFKESGEIVNIHFNLEESFHKETKKAYNPTCKAWRIEPVTSEKKEEEKDDSWLTENEPF